MSSNGRRTDPGPKPELAQVSLDLDYSQPLENFPTIFQAEIHAIKRYAQFNLDRRYKRRELASFSDSETAIKSLSSYVINY